MLYRPCLWIGKRRIFNSLLDVNKTISCRFFFVCFFTSSCIHTYTDYTLQGRGDTAFFIPLFILNVSFAPKSITRNLQLELPHLEFQGLCQVCTLVTLIAVQDILIIFKHFSSQDILIRDRTFSDFWKLWRKLFNSCRNTIRKGEKH